MLTGSLEFVVIGGRRAEDALRRACRGIGLQTRITAAPDPDAAAEVLTAATDAVICLSDPRPDALARLITARPQVPVYLVAELPAATEARFLGAGVRAVVSPDRLDRLPVEIVRELDLRARHEAVEVRHRSTDERLTKLAEHVRGILYELNETTLRYEYVGPLAEAIIGHPAEQLSSPEFRRARIHPADLPAYDDHYHRKARSGLGGQTTYRMVGANGKVVWLQDSVSRHRRTDGTTGLTGLLVDVTTLRVLEETNRILTQLTARYIGDDYFRELPRALTKALGVRAAIVGEVIRTEPARIRPLAAAVDGALRQLDDYPLEGSPCDSVAAGASHFVARGLAAAYPSCPVVAAIGAESYFGMPLVGADGRTIGLIAVLDDGPLASSERIEAALALSAGRAAAELERRRAERKQEQLRAQLVQAQKLEAIGTLAGGVAHDFNNVLMGILGNAEMARDELEPWNPAQGYLDEILRAIDRARGVVQRILTFSRNREPERRVGPLGPVIEDVAALLRATLPSSIRVEVQLVTPPMAVDADPDQIHQVLANLATNAAHAIGVRQGAITISEAVVDSAALLQAGTVTLPPGRYVRITVRDTGTGIPADVLPRIFEPFFTTKPPGEGSGLGLAVVHGIMEEHGGAVRVDSEVGRGTEVQLFFPAGRRRPRPDRHAVGQHVLFVDDEAAIVKVGQQMLERLGFRVTAAETASDALAAFAAAPTSFDLVVSDLTMPDRSGLDLATAIHELNPGIRFVLTTGHPDAIDRSAPPGVAAVLAKPFGSEALAAVISRVLGPSAPR